MARFLFVVPPLAGHVNPTISVGRELARRGHEVAWAGPSGEVERLLPPDARLFAVGGREIGEAAHQRREQYQQLRHVAALKFLWEEVLIPLALATVDDVGALVESWRPDVLVADQQALAGAAAARRRGLPWATSATSAAELVGPLSTLPRVEQWVGDRLAELQVAAGVPDERAAIGDLRFSEHLVLVYSSPELVGEDLSFPPHYAFVGPSISDRPEPQPFPWEWFDPAVPHVLVSLGTIPADSGRRFFTVATDALAGEPLQAVLVAPPDLLGDRPVPGNVLMQARVPQLGLLRNVRAVVCHGGDNTVGEALAHGVPLVVAPIRDAQPTVADLVVRAGAGIRVHFGRVEAAELREAVTTVLDEPAHRGAAGRIQQSFRAAGGAGAAATRLEDLAATGGSRPGKENRDPTRHAGTVT